MKYQLYKPNSKNEGCAMGFEIGKGRNGEPALYISAVQQSGWDDQKKRGSFGANAKDPNKSGNFKMNAAEAGEMISSIRSRTTVDFFHRFDNDTTIIKFVPWDKKRTTKVKGEEQSFVTPAFGLTISKNSSIYFKVSLEAGETEVLAILLAEFIRQDMEFAQRKAQEDYQNKNGNGGDRESTRSKPADKPKEEDPFDDDVPF
ncbi:hypothetical protein N9955_00880 [bacterium]|nr:hypothetical protein [bacterium]